MNSFTLVTQTQIQAQTQTQRNVTTSNASIKITTQDAEIIKNICYSCVGVCVKACVSENYLFIYFTYLRRVALQRI